MSKQVNITVSPSLVQKLQSLIPEVCISTIARIMLEQRMRLVDAGLGVTDQEGMAAVEQFIRERNGAAK